MKKYIVLICYFVLLTILIIMSYLLEDDVAKLIFKMLVSTAFVFIGIYSYLKNKSIIRFLALIGCFLGDLFIALSESLGDLFLIIGLVSFLIAHILFIYSTFKTSKLTIYEFIFPIIMVLVILGLSYLPCLDIGDMLPYGLIYIFFVSWLFTRGLQEFKRYKDINSLCFMIAGLLFFLSDFVLMFVMFYTGKFIIGVGLNYILYFGSMYILAMNDNMKLFFKEYKANK